MNTLFLDFDGPLFPDRYIRFHSGQNKPYPGRVEMPDFVDYWVMDPLAVEMLNFLHDIFPFQTVVSSTWKRFINQEQCQDLFFENGLKLHLADPWCTVKMQSNRRDSCVRADEILAYKKEHEITEYIVLDDPWSGRSIDEAKAMFDQNRVVMVNPDVGIDSGDYNKMMRVVRKWAGMPEPISYNLW